MNTLYLMDTSKEASVILNLAHVNLSKKKVSKKFAKRLTRTVILLIFIL
jgi:hypothetical protein